MCPIQCSIGPKKAWEADRRWTTPVQTKYGLYNQQAKSEEQNVKPHSVPIQRTTHLDKYVNT